MAWVHFAEDDDLAVGPREQVGQLLQAGPGAGPANGRQAKCRQGGHVRGALRDVDGAFGIPPPRRHDDAELAAVNRLLLPRLLVPPLQAADGAAAVHHRENVPAPQVIRRPVELIAGLQRRQGGLGDAEGPREGRQPLGRQPLPRLAVPGVCRRLAGVNGGRMGLLWSARP